MLPAVDWWENCYVPLGECVERFRRLRAGDQDALAVAARSRHEIDLYRRHPGAFGYVFFAMRLDAGRRGQEAGHPGKERPI